MKSKLTLCYSKILFSMTSSHSSSYINTFYYFVGGRDVIDPSSVEAPIEVKKVSDMTVDVTEM